MSDISELTKFVKFLLPLEQFADLYTVAVGSNMWRSKYDEHRNDLVEKLRSRLYDFLKKKKDLDVIPRMRSVIKIADRYSNLLDEHPTYATVEALLLPELVNAFMCGVENYDIAIHSGWSYEQYVASLLLERFNAYKNKLIRLKELPGVQNIDEVEEVLTRWSRIQPRKPGKPRKNRR